MKTPLLTLVLLAVPALAFAQSESESASQTAQNRTDRNVATQEDLVERDARVDCIRYTGTRIVKRTPERDATVDEVDELDRDDCVAAGGRVYSQEDLRRTGRTDVADALRALDPAIR